ncbi:hypothetical protein [Caudoviricetes sp.]|nr:hypothetical protein [Caudoviricetes sp.]
MNPDEPTTPPPAGGGGPVRKFWEWIKQRNQQEQAAQLEQTKAVARGVTGAAIATVQTIAEGAAWVDRRTGLGEALQPGFNEAYDGDRPTLSNLITGRQEGQGARGMAQAVTDPLRAAQENYLGKRSDDWVAGAVEETTQFLTGFLALGQVRVAAGGAKLAQGGYLTALARGAAVDAAAFDPYEAQLAELAARSNIPGLDALGEILSVQGDDAPIVARLKRSAAGAALGVSLDGLVAAARFLKAKSAGNVGVMQEQEAILEAVENGTSREAVPIVIRPSEAGEDAWELVLRKDSALDATAETTPSPVFPSRAEAQAQANSMNAALTPLPPPADIAALGNSVRSRLKGAVDAAGEVSDETMEDIARETLGSVRPEEVTTVLTELGNDTSIQSAVNKMAQAHSRNLGNEIAAMDAILQSRPHDVVAKQRAIDKVVELITFEDSRKWVVGEQGRALRLEGTKNPKAPKSAPSAPTARPQGEAGAAATTATKSAGPDVAGMATRDASAAAVNEANVRQITRLFRLAGGSPKDVTAAIQATNIIQKTGKTEKALEWFTNALLSNPATTKTIVLSGQMIQSFEALGRIGGGLLSGNRALSREGVDILFGNYTHLAENLRMARRALNEGQSVINPAPAHHAIGGTTGQVVRMPGHVALAGDEFTRVTNYRSYIRAKSLRQGREWGLSEEKLAAHVEADLRAAFDPETGIATVPEALQYAERSTLSGPLGINSLGGSFGAFVRETPGLQFLAPFMKAGTNIFRFTTMHTPGLARLNQEARAIMAAGGEEAAALQAKQTMAGAVYTTAGILALSGNLTGDAPGDPALRDLWLKSHQPYSVRIGDQWYSYRRTDPLGVMLGLVADYTQFANQMTEQDPDMEQLAIAMTSAAATGILTPSYMKGIGDFLDAFADGTPSAINRWKNQFASSFVPAGLNAVNSDPYFREVRSLADALKNRIPGLSQTLDPKYDMFGEPVLNGGTGNRSALFKTKSAAAAVEDELASLGRGFANFPSKTPSGIDLADRSSFDNGTGVSPYNRIMELVRAPNAEGKTLRQRVEEVVRSERYQNASPGTADYPGGRRWDLVARERTRAYDRAFRQVQQEYPLLREEVRRSTRLNRAAYRGGEDALTRAEELFGTLQQSRPLKSSKLQQR